jgi:hypothetical protein
MPCAAPCSRLPCNQRCGRFISCGHQCPGICGESCPEDYCQTCSNKRDARVDLLEMKTYEEIDLNETPIVVLGCGHFFTAETLDGHMGMSEVYTVDGDGEFTGLRDASAVLARSIPLCPDCQCPVRQHATQRYNRVINRAVIDEMSKRFLVSGQLQIRALEQQVLVLERDLESTRLEIIRSNEEMFRSYGDEDVSEDSMHATTLSIPKLVRERGDKCKKLEKAIKTFRNSFHNKNAPARKLHEATVHAARKAGLDQLMEELKFDDSTPALSRDHQITLRGRMLEVKTDFLILDDKFTISRALESTPSTATATLSEVGSPGKLAIPFFQICTELIEECNIANLPRLAVEASLFYASIALSYMPFCHSDDGTDADVASTYLQNARDILDKAKELCKQPFQNVEALRSAVDECIRLMRGPWYEKVTTEEIAAIKSALVSGSMGIATHSGHWYNCKNGHPVS